jgi:hypothetical protein
LAAVPDGYALAGRADLVVLIATLRLVLHQTRPPPLVLFLPL